jgi:hypothetical protein
MEHRKKGGPAVSLYSVVWQVTPLQSLWHDICFALLLAMVLRASSFQLSYENKLQIISQPVLFIVCFFSLYVVWLVKILNCIIFCHFAAHMKIDLTKKQYELNPSQ